MRKEEISALSGPNEFAEFYSRLRVIKDYHRKYPNEVRRFFTQKGCCTYRIVLDSGSDLRIPSRKTGEC